MFVVQAIAPFDPSVLGTKSAQDQKGNKLNYLQFQAGRKLLTKVQYPNGWWIGCLLGEDIDPDQEEDGFFPSNYVRSLNSVPQPKTSVAQEYTEQNNLKTDTFEKEEKSKDQVDWKQYILKQIMKDHQEQKNVDKVDAKDKFEEFLKSKEPELKAGIKGYRKVKITQDNKVILNRGDVIYNQANDQYAYIPIKDQSENSKAYRQLDAFFNYDQWVDEKNKQKQTGGVQKPFRDPGRKKDKNQRKILRLSKIK